MDLIPCHLKDMCKRIPAFLFLVFFIPGCVGINPPAGDVHYYALEYEPAPKTGRPSIPETIRVDQLQVAPLYDTDRMVYREKAYQRGQYLYHRWRSNPRDMVTYYITRDMAQSGLFKGVFSDRSLYPAGYRLTGTVLDFCEYDENEWYALLSLDMVLMNATEPDVNRRIMFQKVYKSKIRCKDKTPMALAEAMSKAMAQISGEIISDVYHHVSLSTPKTSN